MQGRVIQALFASYFGIEEDITSHEVLKRAGVNAGLDESEVNEWLKSDKGGKEVDKEVRQAQRWTLVVCRILHCKVVMGL